MVERTNTNIAREIDKPAKSSPNNASALRSSKLNRHSDEDIIMSLSNAYENKRARQVFEWERAQSLNVRRTA